MPTKPLSVNLLLPEGLTPDRYHALAARLVGKLAPGAKAGKGYLALSELEGAPPAHMPILNDSTWTLTLPTPAGADLDAMSASARSLPDGEGVEVEAGPDYRASSRDA